MKIKKLISQLLAITLAGLFLVGCSSSSSSNKPPTRSPANLPIAHAGTSQNVQVGDLVTLDGSSSYSPSQKEITYSWKAFSLPEGSSAQLNSESSVRPSFTPDHPGEYKFSLTVNDGKSNSSASFVVITATVANSQPVANAGSNIETYTGTTITLDASKSYDANDDPLTYQWILVSAPQENEAQLSSTTFIKPTFTPELPGEYVFQLIVNDGELHSEPSTVSVIATIENIKPVANAGPDRIASIYDWIILSGSGSYDDSDDLLTYSWAFKSKPENSNATLLDADTETPSFQPDTLGDYVVQLIVNDGKLDSEPSTVVISIENSKPIASAGPEQVVFSLEKITLNGSESYDSDGGSLSFQWVFSSKPTTSTAELLDSDTAAPSFTPDAYGNYLIQLVVNDGIEDSEPSVVRIQVLHPDSKQDYLASKINITLSSSATSKTNNYYNSGSKFGIITRNNSNQKVTPTKFEVTDGNGAIITSTEDSSLLNNGSLNQGESFRLTITLMQPHPAPLRATVYFTDPLDGDKSFSKTYIFAN